MVFLYLIQYHDYTKEITIIHFIGCQFFDENYIYGNSTTFDKRLGGRGVIIKRFDLKQVYLIK